MGPHWRCHRLVHAPIQVLFVFLFLIWLRHELPHWPLWQNFLDIFIIHGFWILQFDSVSARLVLEDHWRGPFAEITLEWVIQFSLSVVSHDINLGYLYTFYRLFERIIICVIDSCSTEASLEVFIVPVLRADLVGQIAIVLPRLEISNLLFSCLFSHNWLLILFDSFLLQDSSVHWFSRYLFVLCTKVDSRKFGLMVSFLLQHFFKIWLSVVQLNFLDHRHWQLRAMRSSPKILKYLLINRDVVFHAIFIFHIILWELSQLLPGRVECS